MSSPFDVLVSEPITNALKYVAADANGSGQIEVEPCPHPTGNGRWLLVKKHLARRSRSRTGLVLVDKRVSRQFGTGR